MNCGRVVCVDWPIRDHQTGVCGYLVPQQVLLVAGGVSGHLQAENTQQEARVSVEAGKVLEDVRIEGRAIRTHLQVTPELMRAEDKH